MKVNVSGVLYQILKSIKTYEIPEIFPEYGDNVVHNNSTWMVFIKIYKGKNVYIAVGYQNGASTEQCTNLATAYNFSEKHIDPDNISQTGLGAKLVSARSHQTFLIGLDKMGCITFVKSNSSKLRKDIDSNSYIAGSYTEHSLFTTPDELNEELEDNHSELKGILETLKEIEYPTDTPKLWSISKYKDGGEYIDDCNDDNWDIIKRIYSMRYSYTPTEFYHSVIHMPIDKPIILDKIIKDDFLGYYDPCNKLRVAVEIFRDNHHLYFHKPGSKVIKKYNFRNNKFTRNIKKSNLDNLLMDTVEKLCSVEMYISNLQNDKKHIGGIYYKTPDGNLFNTIPQEYSIISKKWSEPGRQITGLVMIITVSNDKILKPKSKKVDTSLASVFNITDDKRMKVKTLFNTLFKTLEETPLGVYAIKRAKYISSVDIPDIKEITTDMWESVEVKVKLKAKVEEPKEIVKSKTNVFKKNKFKKFKRSVKGPDVRVLPEARQHTMTKEAVLDFIEQLEEQDVIDKVTEEQELRDILKGLWTEVNKKLSGTQVLDIQILCSMTDNKYRILRMLIDSVYHKGTDKIVSGTIFAKIYYKYQKFQKVK